MMKYLVTLCLISQILLGLGASQEMQRKSFIRGTELFSGLHLEMWSFSETKSLEAVIPIYYGIDLSQFVQWQGSRLRSGNKKSRSWLFSTFVPHVLHNSFPSSAWERISWKLCFRCCETELRKDGFPSRCLGTRVQFSPSYGYSAP